MIESSSFAEVLRCQRPKCCRYSLYWQDVDNRQVLVPLSGIKLSGKLEAGHALLQARLTYNNQLSEKPLECTFEFPVDSSTVVNSVRATVGERSVEAVIQNKEEAKEKYDDAVASGKAAVYVERRQKQQALTLQLGNLLPGQQATVEIELCAPLKVYGSAYEFAIPLSFMPRY